MEKKITPSTTVGLIISLISIVLSLVLYFTNLYTEQWTQYIGLLVLFGGIIWAVRNHGKEQDFTATFGQLFAFGFKTTAVITCIMILYTILSGYIFPDIKEKILANATEQALAKPGVNEEQVRQGMEMFSNNYNLFMILGILFWTLAAGAIASLIGAAVTKKTPKPLKFDDI
jgi:hypothetical protein